MPVAVPSIEIKAPKGKDLSELNGLRVYAEVTKLLTADRREAYTVLLHTGNGDVLRLPGFRKPQTLVYSQDNGNRKASASWVGASVPKGTKILLHGTLAVRAEKPAA